jgi:hypothetical protein
MQHSHTIIFAGFFFVSALVAAITADATLKTKVTGHGFVARGPPMCSVLLVYNFYKTASTYVMGNIFVFKKYVLLASLISDNVYRCETLSSLMRNAISRPLTRHIDEQLGGCTRIETRLIKPDIERLLRKNSFKHLTNERFC